MSTALVLVEQVGHIARLTLNRPTRRNALSPQLIAELEARLGEAQADPAVHAVVLTGAGPVFCAGGDLGAGGMADGALAQHEERAGFARLLERMVKSPTPLLAAVQGDALGGGFGLVAACHLVVMDERAELCAPELKVGLFPMMIAPVLARCLPHKLLIELILTSRRMGAAEAHRVGFANRVAPAGESLTLCEALAGEIASRSPAVVALGLSAVAAVEDAPIAIALRHLHGQLTLNLQTEDAAEGITAFISRRPPTWRGR